MSGSQIAIIVAASGTAICAVVTAWYKGRNGRNG